MVTRGPQLRLDDLVGNPPQSAFSFIDAASNDGAAEFLNSGRTALYRGLESYLDTGTVLLPAYISYHATLPFSRTELDVDYYRVNRDLEPDLDDLTSKITGDTVAVMTVNYFGFPQRSFRQVSRLCEEYDLHHIEDSAHAGLSTLDGELLGTRGDWGFTSLHKLFPVPDGGVLFRDGDGLILNTESAGTDGMEFVLRNVIRRLDDAVFDGVSVQLINELTGRGGRSDRFEVSGMSWLTDRVLRFCDVERLRRQRRQNYERLATLLPDEPSIDIVYSSPRPGICPFVCPVTAAYPVEAIRQFRSVNVPVDPWARLPRRVQRSDEFPTANYLSNHVLTVPIHQTADTGGLTRQVERLLAASPW